MDDPEERKKSEKPKVKKTKSSDSMKKIKPKEPGKKACRLSYEEGHNLTNDEKMAIPKFKCYYQLGDSTPWYIEVQGWEKTVGRLKERILETRGARGTAPDLFGVKNITQFAIYPPGRNEKTGKPIHPELDDYDAPIPTHSSMKDPIIVPAKRDTAKDDAAKNAIADLVAAKMAKKKAKKAAAKKAGKKEAPPEPEPPKPITVKVRLPDGKTIPVEMQPSDNIQFIKEKVAPEAGVEVPKQVLQFNDTELPSEKTAVDMGLEDGSVIDLMPNNITVQVRTPDGKTFPVEMKPSDSIQFIKEAVAPNCGIEVPDQVMTSDDKELPSEKTADDMGLKDGSIIDLAPKPITVMVKTPDDKMIPVMMRPSDIIKFIKEKVAPEAGIEVPDQILKFNGDVLPNKEAAKDMGLKDGSVIDLVPAEPKPITVQVRTPDGKTIPVIMKPSDSILSIKESIAPEAGMDVPDQVLTFNGKELADGETAIDMGLQDDSVIDLEPKPITFNIKTPDGKMIPVTMKASETIKSIKEKVAPEAGIEVAKQVLKFKDKVLPDDDSAETVGLKDGDVIDLVPPPITVKVRTPDGKIIPVTMKPSDSIFSIKENVAPEAGIEVPKQVLTFDGKELPNDKSADGVGLKDGDVIDLVPPPITVKVKTPDGKIIPVTMKPSDSILSIKENVAPEAGIEVPKQVLTFDGKELPDDKSANAMGLKDGDVIDLAPPPITVKVKTPDGKIIPVTMKPSNSILSVKENVAPEAGIEVPKQVLTFDGKELPDDKSADAMGLKDGDVIDLAPPPITVKVKTPDGKIIPVTIDPSDSILSIKENVAPEAGIEVPQQIMKFDGKELPDDKSADAMGLKDGDVIDLSPKSVTVYVKTPDGKTISVPIDPSDRIESIKHAVAPESGIEVPMQVMKLEGNELSNDGTADGAGLRDGSVIDLTPRPITVQVKTPDGKTISVTLDPSESIQAVKEAVAPASGIEVPQQVLKFEGGVLPNDKTLDGAGLKDGDVIDLMPKPITVKVRTPDGKIIPVEMDPSGSIESIKENVAPTAGIAVTDQTIKFGGKELPNGETAEAMGLKDGSIIDLEAAGPEGTVVFVKTPDGKKIALAIEPSDTIESIKTRVVDESSIKVYKQIMHFQDTFLHNEDTAADSGLKDGSIIDLTVAKDAAEYKKLDTKARKRKEKDKKKSKDSDCKYRFTTMDDCDEFDHVVF